MTDARSRNPPSSIRGWRADMHIDSSTGLMVSSFRSSPSSHSQETRPKHCRHPALDQALQFVLRGKIYRFADLKAFFQKRAVLGLTFACRIHGGAVRSAAVRTCTASARQYTAGEYSEWLPETHSPTMWRCADPRHLALMPTARSGFL